MSIWRHLTDIELQRLKEASRGLRADKDELERLDRLHQETSVKLYTAQEDMKRYEELAVARAVGEYRGELPPIPPTEADLKVLLSGLTRKRHEQRQTIKYSEARYESLVDSTARACIARAADVYRQQTAELAKTWKQINSALAMLEIPELAWRQIFIPALSGMTTEMSHSRPVLFDGCNPNAIGVEAELAALLS